MSQDKHTDRKPTAGKKHLTPGQIGAGLGAGATTIAFLVWRELSQNRPSDATRPFSFLIIGVLAGIGGVIGLGVGTLIGKYLPAESANPPSALSPGGARPSVMGRFFAVLSVLCVPVLGFGLIFGIVGLILNRKARGWPWILSIVGSVLSGLVTAIVVVVIARVASTR